ncbi:hypothetical protein [Sphaerochaeta sp. PS]|uniref:hypothetical protein n=1 Tax=Sphaerochaeta sp. PS TaxID=3076336 RepID=UPI0028A4D729|nr:hypothetical protein [Sphaerochaeta sp. PS]MDT4761553.1 hypothetical protein [Sphaerochaeta sp. PS]
MFYRIRLYSKNPLYSDCNRANKLLLKLYLALEQQGGSILDYSLLPNQLDLLVYIAKGASLQGLFPRECSIESIPTEDLLLQQFGSIGHHLPKYGKEYPLCAHYEAYHKSCCFSSLGKQGPLPTTLTLRTILQAKSSPSGSLQKE